MSRRAAEPSNAAPSARQPASAVAVAIHALEMDRRELNAKEEWEKVGEGSFGHVYKALWYGKAVAVKEASSFKQSRLDALRRDILYLSRYPHPNIVQILGWWEDEGMIFVVMEFMKYSLRDKRCVNRVDLVSVLADVARALVKLHGAGHLHRDVKARNVLVSADYRVAKLADFGLARPLPESGNMTPKIGPRKYRAPEVEAGGDYGLSADMYSFGVMINQLLEQLRSRSIRKYGPSIEFLKALSRGCLRKEPSRRPTALDALACLQHHIGRPIQTVGPPSRWLLSQNGDMGVADGRDDSESPSASSESDSEQRRSGSAPGSARGEAAGGENGPGDGEEHSDGRARGGAAGGGARAEERQRRAATSRGNGGGARGVGGGAREDARGDSDSDAAHNGAGASKRRRVGNR